MDRELVLTGRVMLCAVVDGSLPIGLIGTENSFDVAYRRRGATQDVSRRGPSQRSVSSIRDDPVQQREPPSQTDTWLIQGSTLSLPVEAGALK